MRIYRYMSAKEFNMLSAGITIEGKRFLKCRTSSEGVCFLGSETTFVAEDPLTGDMTERTFSPEMCIRFLGGIVTNDVLVEFEVTDESILRETVGVYANPLSDYWGDYVNVPELCCDSYNRETLVPLRYAIVKDGWQWEWYDCHMV